MKNSIVLRIVAATLTAFLVLINASVAEAAALTAMSDTMSNQTVSANSSHVLKFTTPTGIASSQTFIVTFPSASGFNLTGSAFGNVTITWGASTGAENATTTASSNSATVWGVAFGGTNSTSMTLTAPSGAANGITAGSKVIVTLASTNAVNPSGAANYGISLGGFASTAVDLGTTTVPILTNSQVAVTATVAQSLTFSLSSNSVSLGTLSAAATSSASHTMTLATNGTSGASISYSGSTLTSGGNTIPTCTSTCTAGTAGWGLNLVANTLPVIGSAVSGSAPIGTASSGYNTANSFKFLSGDSVATASNAINTTTYTVSYVANIATLTPAGSYGTSLTYLATANF